MTIEVQGLSKTFGAFAAVDDVSMRVEEGSLTALLGPSGSGKTTVLRLIAGLEIPDGGSISIAGRDVTDMPAQKRNVGFVFQHYALFKHMRVEDNISFPLRVRKWPKGEIRERVKELVSLLRLDGLEKRYPSQISGGQRQRVALARALAARPSVLLLDEPFSALDARVRDELREWLRGLHEQIHVTSVFVTHDQSEAVELADRIVIMNDGRVAQEGTPDAIAIAPASPFVFEFLGKANVIAGRAEHGEADFLGVRVPYPGANGTPLSVVGYVRPQLLHLAAAPGGLGAFEASVERLVVTGPTVKVHLVVCASGQPLMAEVGRREADMLGLAPGHVVYASPDEVTVFAP